MVEPYEVVVASPLAVVLPVVHHEVAVLVHLWNLVEAQLLAQLLAPFREQAYQQANAYLVVPFLEAVVLVDPVAFQILNSCSYLAAAFLEAALTRRMAYQAPVDLMAFQIWRPHPCSYLAVALLEAALPQRMAYRAPVEARQVERPCLAAEDLEVVSPQRMAYQAPVASHLEVVHFEVLQVDAEHLVAAVLEASNCLVVPQPLAQILMETYQFSMATWVEVMATWVAVVANFSSLQWLEVQLFQVGQEIRLTLQVAAALPSKALFHVRHPWKRRHAPAMPLELLKDPMVGVVVGAGLAVRWRSSLQAFSRVNENANCLTANMTETFASSVIETSTSTSTCGLVLFPYSYPYLSLLGAAVVLLLHYYYFELAYGHPRCAGVYEPSDPAMDCHLHQTQDLL